MNNFEMEIPIDNRDRPRAVDRQHELALRKRVAEDKNRDRGFILERERAASLSERMLAGRMDDRIPGSGRFMDRERDSRLVGGGGEWATGVDRRGDSALGVSRMEGAESGPRLETGGGIDRRLDDGADRRLEIAGDLNDDREAVRAGGRSASFERLRSTNRDRDEGREKLRDRAREDNGGTREKQKEDSVGSFQELVAQYKSALAELTFNSKPIITNLTIIAGENAHAAVAIAATVCAHILEVPNEQKLPSLYLLDSIVKNIGGEYVKHFTAKLPEVFCTAYRQVDPATYPAMQHLFRTWRGVFSGAPLRIIEAELQFSPMSNGPFSTSNSTKPVESPSQRPGHSIHVNPKYLEAQRQRLQQPSKAETVPTESNGDPGIHEAEQAERVLLDSEKSWSDPSKRSLPLPRSRTDGFVKESGYSRKMPLNLSNYDYGLGDPGPDIGARRTTDREDTWERGWLRESEETFRTSEGVSGLHYGHRNGFELKQSSPRALVDAYGSNIRGSRALRMPLPPPPPPLHPFAQPLQDPERSRGSSRIWQNSEEEEYIWEDMNPRLLEHNRLRDTIRKRDWFPGDDKSVIPGALGREKPAAFDQPHSEHVGWRRIGPMPLTDRPLSAESRLPLRREADEHMALSSLQQDTLANVISNSGLDVPALGPNSHFVSGQHLLPSHLPHHLPQQLSPPAQSRLRLLQQFPLPNRNPLPVTASSVLSQSTNPSAPFSTGSMSIPMGSSLTMRASGHPSVTPSFGGGLLNFGSLSPVTPALSLPLQQRQAQRPLSPTVVPPLQSPLPLPPLSVSSVQSNVQLSQHQQMNLAKPIQQGESSILFQSQQPPLHVPQQLVQQLPQAVQQTPQQLYPLQQQLIQPLSIPLPQPTSEQYMSTHHLPQTTPSLSQLPSHLLQSLQQLQSHLPPRSMVSSLPQPQSSPSPQRLQSSTPPMQQGQLSNLLQQLQPPSQQLQSQTQQPSQPSLVPGFVAQQMVTLINDNPPSSSSQSHMNTGNLLAAFLQSGIMPPSQASQILSHPSSSTPSKSSVSPMESIPSQVSSQHQPPLPSGPPPIQLPTSNAGSTLTQGALSLPPAAPSLASIPLPPVPALPLVPPLANLPVFASQPMRVVQPPLPPGPPPMSSQAVSSVAQSSVSVGIQPPMSNLSTLFSSLMSQGLISALSTAAPVLSQSGAVMANSNTSVAVAFPNSNVRLNTSGALVPPVGTSLPAVATVPATLVTAHRTQIPAGLADPQDQAMRHLDPIGTEFRQEILREQHESVINALYNDFPRQCKTCGLRFKLQEDHSKHMDWHVSRNRRQKLLKKISRKWFVGIKEWLSGTGSSASEVVPSFLPEDVVVKSEEHERVAVPADENQSACALCGEPFEDFYSDETEEWMYKGAVYMNAPPGGLTDGLDTSVLGPIVHAKCRSESAMTVDVDSADEGDVEEDDELGHRTKRLRY